MARVTRQSVLLCAPAPSLGLLGGRSHFPVPDFGDRCVCCGAAETATLDYDPSGDQQAAGSIEIPVCDACAAHVSTRTHGLFDVLLALAGGCGVLVLLVGLGGALVYGPEALWATLCGTLSAAAAALAFALCEARDRRRAESGHHALHVGVSPGRCVVSTTNARLIDELLTRNPGAMILQTIARGITREH